MEQRMRNPRLDPQKGDVLEHYRGERRVVLARVDPSTVKYGHRESNTTAQCTCIEWQEWAKETSILDFGSASNA
jgi:hypothetical protein